MRLKDKVAIVTGSARGLGREIALAYAEEGANLVLADITQNELESVAQEVIALGRKAIAIPTDVSIEERVNRMVQKTIDALRRIDILVNNAGGSLGSYMTMICDLSVTDWSAVINTNVTGTFLCSRAVLRHMMQQKSGIIINLSSGMGTRARAGMGAYSAAKFAIEGLTQAMALETSSFNIRVNAIGPGGRTATPSMLKKRTEMPLEQMLQPRIIRELAIYLASDDSAGITGQSFRAVTWLRDKKDTQELIERRSQE